MADQIDRELEPFALTNAQWLPLFKLDQGQANTATALARECRMDCGAMTRMLDRFEHKQLLQRHRNDEDRRVVNLALTDKGRDVAE
jgi:DNA-binding MarR family transcriptional regulator